MKISVQHVAFLVSGLLLWAIFPFNPYGYYQLLKVIVFCYMGYLVGSNFFKGKQEALLWIAIGIGLLYNPLFTIHLGRPIWTVVNVITVALLLWITHTKTTKPK